MVAGFRRRCDAELAAECNRYRAAAAVRLKRSICLFYLILHRDVVGLCKLAKLEGEDGIIDQDYSLNPGRYVGVVIEDDGMTEEEFKAEMLSLNEKLETLNSEARLLETEISNSLLSLLGVQ